MLKTLLLMRHLQLTYLPLLSNMVCSGNVSYCREVICTHDLIVAGNYSCNISLYVAIASWLAVMKQGLNMFFTVSPNVTIFYS